MRVDLLQKAALLGTAKILRKTLEIYRAKWYDHVPDKVVETDQVKILWDLNIRTKASG